MSIGFICIMGMGTVFVGLVCIVVITMLVSLLCKSFEKPQTVSENASVPQATLKSADNAPIENKQEIIAASCAAIAEDLGEDVKNIKVTSFKKL